MTKELHRSSRGRLAPTAIALASLIGSLQATQAGQWWVGMAKNYWSPQSALTDLVGKAAVDCGQFGPGVGRTELVRAITCIDKASRDLKPSFAIRHFLGPLEKVFDSFESQRWLADGLYSRSDGTIHRFDYRGFWMSVMLHTTPRMQPDWQEMPCKVPEVIPDSAGTVKFGCR